jgi:hypothetical protein
MIALSILYAHLELEFGLFRATTPKYLQYSYPYKTHSPHLIQADKSPVAMAIKDATIRRSSHVDVDVDAVTRNSRIVRADVVSKLNEWNGSGVIELKTGGVRHVHQLLRKLPSTPGEIEEIVKKLYSYMQAREKQDLQRTKAVISLITSESCISRRLAAYFGEGSEGLPAECGHCVWCETHTKVSLPEVPPAPPGPALINAVLETCRARDDPRFLARVAFGIVSPRVTKMKLKEHPVFGCMNRCDFMVCR